MNDTIQNNNNHHNHHHAQTYQQQTQTSSQQHLPSSHQISQYRKNLLFQHLLDISNDVHNKGKQNKQPLGDCKNKQKQKYIKQSFKLPLIHSPTSLLLNKSSISQRSIMSRFHADLGSLGQFMPLKQNDINNANQFSSLYQNKKKRMQRPAQDDRELRDCIGQYNLEQQILKSKNTTLTEKKLASKVVVDKIFQDAFGEQLQTLLHQHKEQSAVFLRPDNQSVKFSQPSRSRKNSSEKTQRGQSKSRATDRKKAFALRQQQQQYAKPKDTTKINIDALSDVLDTTIQKLSPLNGGVYHTKLGSQKFLNTSTRSQANNLLSTTVQSVLFGNTKDTQNNCFQRKKKKRKCVHIAIDPKAKQNAILQFKSKYNDLKPIQIPSASPQLDSLIEIQSNLSVWEKYIKKQNSFYSSSSIVMNARNSLIGYEPVLITEPTNIEKKLQDVGEVVSKVSKNKIVVSKQTVLRLTYDEIIIKKIQFRDLSIGLYMLNTVKLQMLEKVNIENVRIEQSLLMLFLDIMVGFAAKHLKQFIIGSVAIQNMTRLTQKLKKLLQQISIVKFGLNYLDIGSKEFVQLCISFVENPDLQIIELRNNRIDNLCIKALQTIIKNCPKIKVMDLRNNEICSSSLKFSNIEKEKILL